MGVGKKDALELLDIFDKAVSSLREAIEVSELPQEDWEEICAGLGVMAMTVGAQGEAISIRIAEKLIARLSPASRPRPKSEGWFDEGPNKKDN